MSGRFVRGPEGAGAGVGGEGGANPDSTLSCSLCKARMQVSRGRWQN